MQLVNMFPDMDKDPLNDDHFLEAIQKIERENKLIPVQNPPNAAAKTITSNYIQNVNPHFPMPHMFFPNSNVTVNYNFNQK